MKIRPDAPRNPASLSAPSTRGPAAMHTTTAQATPTTAPPSPPAPAGSGKRFDAHSLPPPSTATYQPQPGKKAVLDLRAWQPPQLREAMLSDIAAVYDLLVKLPPAVTFFGGARIQPEDPYYAISQRIGALLAMAGAPIRTGAGPGIMTAGPEGYKAALRDSKATTEPLDPGLVFHPVVNGHAHGGVDVHKTQGFRIKLPFEQDWSSAIDVGAEAQLFPYRKLALYENCRGVAVFPGGYGTLDELFEVWALGEAGLFHKPKAAVGVAFWNAILDPIRKVAVAGQGGRALIPVAEWNKLKVTDAPEEIVQHFAQASSSTKVFERPPLERAKKLAREIDESIAVLDRLPPSVTFLGGRRLDDDDPTLATAKKLAEALARDGVPLRVGSSGVVAEAVCAGAAAGDDQATVQGILLGKLVDQTRALPNLRVHQAVDELVTHKEIVGRRSQAFVALPGGLNTLGEVFSVLTQIQTGHLPKIPVVLVGKDYWQPIFDAIKKTMLSPERRTIAPEDLDLVTITDDPQEALCVLRPALTATGKQSFVPVEGEGGATLFEGPKAAMLNPPGQAMASWLWGGPKGKNEILPDVAYDVATSRAVVVERLDAALVEVLDDKGIDMRHVAWALDHGVDGAQVQRLLEAGAGPQAFRFVWACAPFSAYREIGKSAEAIARRWAPHAEVVFQRMVELATSKHLINPDALKSWIEGIAAPAAPGDGFATMLGDAWDLVSAGHTIAVEETAAGVGDILDLTENVVYQHKRVLSSHLAPALRKAAEQLKGTDHTPSAPPGMKGIIHLDLRANVHWNGLDDATIQRRVTSMVFPRDRVDRIQILLDDRLLTFDRDGQPLPA